MKNVGTFVHVRRSVGDETPLQHAVSLLTSADDADSGVLVARSVRFNTTDTYQYGYVAPAGALLALLSGETCLRASEYAPLRASNYTPANNASVWRAAVYHGRAEQAELVASGDACGALPITLNEVVMPGPRRVFADLETSDAASLTRAAFDTLIGAFRAALVASIAAALGPGARVHCAVADSSHARTKWSAHVVARAHTPDNSTHYMCANAYDCALFVADAIGRIADAGVRAKAASMCDFAVYATVHPMRTIASSKAGTGATAAPDRTFVPWRGTLADVTRECVRHNLITAALVDDSGTRAAELHVLRPLHAQRVNAVRIALAHSLRLPSAGTFQGGPVSGAAFQQKPQGTHAPVGGSNRTVLPSVVSDAIRRAAPANSVAAAAADDDDEWACTAHTRSVVQTLSADSKLPPSVYLASLVSLLAGTYNVALPPSIPHRTNAVTHTVRITTNDKCCPRAALLGPTANTPQDQHPHNHPWEYLPHGHNHIYLHVDVSGSGRVSVGCFADRCKQFAPPSLPLDPVFTEAFRKAIDACDPAGKPMRMPYSKLRALLE